MFAGAEDRLALERLTRIPVKAELYAGETYFREAYGEARRVLGDQVEPVVTGTALMAVKPEGVALGCARVVLDHLGRHGLTPVAAATVQFGPLLWRDAWRYQLTAASLDRLAINELLLTGPALLLLLRGPAGAAVPAAVHASGIKGSADVARQSPDSLRAALAQPNQIFSIIHSADEPADVLRELAIMVPAEVRPRLLARLAAGGPGPEDRAVLDRYAAAGPTRRFDAAASAARLATAVAAALGRSVAGSAGVVTGSAGIAVGRGELGAVLEALRGGGPLHWRTLHDAYRAGVVAADPWDLAVLGSTTITYNRPGGRKAIENVNPALWAAGVLEAAP